MEKTKIGEIIKNLKMEEIIKDMESYKIDDDNYVISNKNTSNKAIGIDLGTTYTCVGFYNDEKVEIIENKNTGLRTTPSVVSFNNKDRIIGEAPRMNENSVYEVKRLIGRKFNDETVQKDIRHWQFKVVNDNSKPKIEVEFNKKREQFYPEQISAMILERMKDFAETHLNCSVTKAVITVPAYFNDAQRQATKDAAAIAGLEVLRIINEPTAAAIAYGFDKRIYEKSNILIYDLGGGTFDISIMEIKEGTFKVIATDGDTHLGGVDFDNRLTEHFIKIFEEKTGYDVSNDKKARNRLKRACEIVKRQLSEAYEATIDIDALYNGEDFNETISRAVFEDLNNDLFEKTIQILENCLRQSKLNKNDIDEIVLIGGSTRIPKIKNLLEEFFENKKINQNINPDEAVAYGAAIQAALCTEIDKPELRGITISDVTPLTLGIEIVGGIMNDIVKRNTTIPLTRQKIYTTVFDNQEDISIKVYQGERQFVKDNHLLGQFVLNGIKKAPRGEPKIQVKFEIDYDGILLVSAEDQHTSASNSISITNHKCNLNEEEISRMIAQAEFMHDEDRIRREKVEIKNEIISQCNTKKNEVRSKINLINRKKYEEEIDSITKWAYNNFEIATKDDLLEKLLQIKKLKIV